MPLASLFPSSPSRSPKGQGMITRRDAFLSVPLACMTASAALADQSKPAIAGACAREDCRISYGGGMMTLMAWSPVYDKHGNQVGGRDPNTHTREGSCSTCGKRWTVASRDGQPDVITQTVPPRPSSEASSKPISDRMSVGD